MIIVAAYIMWRVSEEVLALPKCQTVETNSTQSPPLTSSACAGMPFHVSSPSLGALRPQPQPSVPAFFPKSRNERGAAPAGKVGARDEFRRAKLRVEVVQVVMRGLERHRTAANITG